MSSKNRRFSKRLEQIFPLLLFFLLISIVIFFFNNREGRDIKNDQLETPIVLPTVIFDESLCKVEDKDTFLSEMKYAIPTYDELLFVETECNKDDYEGEVLRLNIKEAYSYLTFALEKDLPIFGWDNLIIANDTSKNESRTQITASSKDKTLQVLVSSVDITSEGMTSITYNINYE